MAIVCRRRRALGIPALSIMRVPESDVAALDGEGGGVVVAADFVVNPVSVRVLSTAAGFRVQADGDDYRILDEDRTSALRRLVRLLRMMGTGAAYAECAELAELAEQIRDAEPLGSPEGD